MTVALPARQGVAYSTGRVGKQPIENRLDLVPYFLESAVAVLRREAYVGQERRVKPGTAWWAGAGVRTSQSRKEARMLDATPIIW